MGNLKAAKKSNGHTVTLEQRNQLVTAYETLLHVDSMAHVLIEALRRQSEDRNTIHLQFQVETMQEMVKTGYLALDEAGFNSM